jgi:hypothetical protein
MQQHLKYTKYSKLTFINPPFGGQGGKKGVGGQKGLEEIMGRGGKTPERE